MLLCDYDALSMFQFLFCHAIKKKIDICEYFIFVAFSNQWIFAFAVVKMAQHRKYAHVHIYAI